MRDGWTETTLGDVADVNMGQSPPGDTYNAEGIGMPFMQGSAEFGEHYPEPVKFCSAPAKIAEIGDLLLSVRAPVGDSNFANQRIAIGRGLATVRAKREADTNFLRLVIQLNTAGLLATSGTGMFSSITGKNLREFGVNLPPLAEQKRIVDVVSSVDSYIDALQQQADTARTARNAALHELLSAGGDDWTETTLGKTLEIARGGSPRPIRDFITTADDGINWIKIGDATASSKYIYHTEQKIRPEGATRSRVVQSGDFILSNSMSFGRPYIMRSDGCIHDGWLLFGKVEKYFDEDFLYNLLLSDLVQKQFDSLAAGSGVRNLNIEVVKEVIIPLPPLSTQKRIAQIANSMDDVIQSTEQAVVEAKNLRSGLLSDLLSGEHEIPASYDSLLGAA